MQTPFISCSNQAGALEKDIFKLVIDEMRRFSQTGTGELYHDGLTQVLAEPEFGEIDLARRALRFFEERTVLDDLLSRTVLTNEMGGVQVLIGGEGTWEELKECSMVLARYGSPGRVTGTLGVLGPMRMPYGRTISTVRFRRRFIERFGRRHDYRLNILDGCHPGSGTVKYKEQEIINAKT